MKARYTKAIIIVHGKSEKQMCEYIKQNLRLKIEIVSDKNGGKSIQVNSIKNILNNTEHKNINKFYNTYPDINLEGKGKKRTIKDFKIFIILDLDDCTYEEAENFKNKQMFKKHWAYDYIVPVYNYRNLEDVLIKCGIKYEKKSSADKKKEYIKIFPTDRKYIENSTDRIQIGEFKQKLESNNNTNMDEMLEYLLN